MRNELDKMITICPINAEVGFSEKCPARQCQFNRSGACCHKEMTEVEPADYLKRNDLLDRAQRAAKRIKAYVYIDQFVMYALNKSLVQVEEHEMRTLLSTDRFYTWPNARKETYWVLEAVFNELFVPKTIKKKNMVKGLGMQERFRIQVEACLMFYA